jgi:glyoxylate reductase
MAKPRVLLSRAWPAKVEARMAEVFDLTPNKGDRALSPAEFRDAFASYDAVLPTVTDKLGESAFDLARPRTKILANYGVGYSHINTTEAARHRIVVTNTPDVLSDCTADLAMTLLLMVARRAGEGEREVREGRWTGWRPTHQSVRCDAGHRRLWPDRSGHGAAGAFRFRHEDSGAKPVRRARRGSGALQRRAGGQSG